MRFCAARAAKNDPFRCVSMTASQSSSVILKSRLSRMMPAQATRMSSEPPAATAASTAPSMSSRDVTSQRTACPPIAAAVSRAPAPSKSATTTVPPSAASRAAVAAPMPRAPPVTRAVLPSNLMPAATIRVGTWRAPRRRTRRADPDAPPRATDQLRDSQREILAVARRHPAAYVVVPPRIDEAAPHHVTRRPQLVEVELEGLGDLVRVHYHDDVLLTRPRIV